MNKLIPIFLRQYNFLWKIRTFLKKLEFKIIKIFFHSRNSIEENSIRVNITWQLIKVSLLPMIMATGTSYLLYKLDKILTPYLPKTYSADALLDSYTSLLGTIAGVGGIFIGLYYAGLTAAGTSIYSTVPNNIRNLLAKERRGSTYMSFLSFVTFLSLALIICNFLGFGACRLGAIFMVFLAGVGIFVFVNLGKLAFNYFDPTILAEPLFYELRASIKNSTSYGFFHNNPSVQKHFNNSATTTIETLKTLTDIIEKQKHLNGQSFFDLSKNTLSLLIFYLNQKNKIPTKSLWYRIRYKHQDWYKSDSTSIELAQRTGTVITPKNVQEINWLEDDLLAIPFNCLKINLIEKRYDLVTAIISWLKAYLVVLAQKGELKQAFVIYKNLITIFLDNTKIVPGKYFDSLENIAVFENLASTNIDLLIAYTKDLETFAPASISELLENIDWLNNKSIYTSNFPGYLLSDIEWLQKTLLFEFETENEILSPDWYKKELIILWHSKRTFENINAFIYETNEIREWVLVNVPLKTNPWLASCFLSRELEYFNKLQNRINQLDNYWRSLLENRHIKKLPWPELIFEKCNESLKIQKQTLLKYLPDLTIALSTKKRTDDFPDYFGQFLFEMSEEIFKNSSNNEIDIAKDLFQGFFKGSLSKFSEIIPDPTMPNWQFNNAFLIACGPILDLIDLSGYIKLFSEYYKNDSLWNKVKETWDQYFSENTKQKLEFMASLINFEGDLSMISASSLHRTTWSQYTYRIFQNEIPRVTDERDSGHGIFRTIGYETIPLHESPLVRTFATERFISFYDGIDVFINEYFYQNGLSKGIKFKRKLGDLRNALKREKENSAYVLERIKSTENPS